LKGCKKEKKKKEKREKEPVNTDGVLIDVPNVHSVEESEYEMLGQ
jgi:hypothetical protein